MNRKIGIVTAEGCALMQAGIERIVIEQEDMKWLGEATSVCHATQLCESLSPEILLLAPNVADYDPALSVLSVQSACPTAKVLILSFCDQPASVRAALNGGAAGYVLKSEAIETIVEAIRVVAQGTPWISPSLLFSQQEAKQMPYLTKQEKHVLGLIITGKTDRQISQILHVHERTVRNYLRQIYNKLGVNTRVEAVTQAFRLGLVS